MTVVRAVGIVLPEEVAGAAVDVRAEWPDAPERLARTDRVCHLALLATFRALGAPAGGDRPIAVVFGSALASLTTNVRFYDKVVRRGVRLADPKRFPYTSPNAAAGEVAIAFGLVGPNLALISGLHAGIDAVATACRLVRAGRAGAALVVAADAASDEAARWFASAGVAIDGPAEGAVALLVERDGPGALCRIDEIAAGPAPAPVGLGAVMALASAVRHRVEGEFGAACPLTGGRAAVRVSLTPG